MPRLPLTAATLLVAGIALAANLRAQQAPAQKPAPHASSKAQPASGSPTTPGADAGQGSSTLQTDKDKQSYAIGMNIGTSLHRQSMDVDPKIVSQGLTDALSGGKTLLTDAEAQAVLEQLQEKLRAAEEQKVQAAADANKKEGDDFLAANRAKDGVVTLPSGLQYKVLRQGTGPKPAETDTVVCNYQGTLINGKVFDSSYERGQPVTVPVGRVIKGWTEALQLMPVGSKWQLVLPPDLAYGARGAGADIGPNATLIFDVELLSIQAPPQPGSAAPAGAGQDPNESPSPKQDQP